MRRALSLLTALALFAVGAALALYGLFAVLYRGDSGGSGDTYVKLLGRDIDADVVGAVSLVLATFALTFAVAFLRRPR